MSRARKVEAEGSPAVEMVEAWEATEAPPDPYAGYGVREGAPYNVAREAYEREAAEHDARQAVVTAARETWEHARDLARNQAGRYKIARLAFNLGSQMETEVLAVKLCAILRD